MAVNDAVAQLPHDPVHFLGEHLKRQAAEAAAVQEASRPKQEFFAAPAHDVWTFAAFLATQPSLHVTLANALLPASAAADELGAARELADRFEADAAAGRAELVRRLRLPGSLEKVADVLWPHVAKLAGNVGPATADELNSKFAADGSGKIELTYGTTEMFHAGLEGFIGPPLLHAASDQLQARLKATPIPHTASGATLFGQMELEHCFSDDSHVPFPSQVRHAPFRSAQITSEDTYVTSDTHVDVRSGSC